MIYRNVDNTIIVQFGTGDIGVANGRILSGNEEEMFPCCLLSQQDGQNEIGALVNPGHEDDPAEPRPDACIDLVFTDIKSVDVVIDHLSQVRKRFVQNGLRVMTMQEITDEVKGEKSGKHIGIHKSTRS